MSFGRVNFDPWTKIHSFLFKFSAETLQKYNNGVHSLGFIFILNITIKIITFLSQVMKSMTFPNMSTQSFVSNGMTFL